MTNRHLSPGVSPGASPGVTRCVTSCCQKGVPGYVLGCVWCCKVAFSAVLMNPTFTLSLNSLVFHTFGRQTPRLR